MTSQKQPSKDGKQASGVAFPRSRYAVFFSVAAVCLGVDLWTKDWIFAKLGRELPGHVWWFWEGHVGLQLSLNRGALFGIGQGWIPLFVILSVVAAIGIGFWLFRMNEARSLWLTVTLGIMTGGIFGNLYDRLGLHGLVDPITGESEYAVRDWILFQWDDAWVWPNFNVADSLLICGAAMLVFHAFFMQPSDVETKSESGDQRKTAS
jgi:signal peptidase II